MPTIVCAQCNQPFYAAKWDAKRGRKYCSRECNKKGQRTRIIKECRYCNGAFDAMPSMASKQHYCSKKCRLDDGWVKRDPSKWSIFVCDWCNKEFETWTYRQPRFCSRQCMSEFGARQPRPNRYKPEIHITKICDWCNKEYPTTTHQVRLRNGRFCSTECRDIANGIRMRGAGNPNYENGHIDDYGPNWLSQSRKVRKRDSYTCQVCKYQGYKKQRALDVHHIKKAKLFNGDYKAANHPSNLITLCRKCHIAVEKEKIKCPVPLLP